MKNQKITDFLESSADYGIFCPPMEAQTAVDFLQRYLLGENWYTVNPISQKQINTEIVHEILLKYSKEYRKERRKWRKKKWQMKNG